MIDAITMKYLEREGFLLNLPINKSIEEIIIKLIKEDNPRYFLAIPLLLKDDFDYDKIIKKLNKNELKNLNKILSITKQIFKKNNFKNFLLNKININEKFTRSEFDYYYNSFNDFLKNKEILENENLKNNLSLRNKLDINKSLSIIFSPGKIKILEKIFNHEPLTNTELKYYYRSIRPYIKAISNEDLRKYLNKVDIIKKNVK
jgi:hypothetical protein